MLSTAIKLEGLSPGDFSAREAYYAEVYLSKKYATKLAMDLPQKLRDERAANAMDADEAIAAGIIKKQGA